MKNLVKLIAPAKINLVLAVGNKREDGFHEVNTIMHALALHDTLTMRRFEEEPNGHGLVIRFRGETSGGLDPLAVPADEN
ncbi:MAG: 4-(cytidine 5'-diphospho)-2-C-methyl-D-erythritol kinase, partial [Eggerthellaceae bacterium]